MGTPLRRRALARPKTLIVCPGTIPPGLAYKLENTATRTLARQTSTALWAIVRRNRNFLRFPQN